MFVLSLPFPLSSVAISSAQLPTSRFPFCYSAFVKLLWPLLPSLPSSQLRSHMQSRGQLCVHSHRCTSMCVAVVDVPAMLAHCISVHFNVSDSWCILNTDRHMCIGLRWSRPRLLWWLAHQRWSPPGYDTWGELWHYNAYLLCIRALPCVCMESSVSCSHWE